MVMKSLCLRHQVVVILCRTGKLGILLFQDCRNNLPCQLSVKRILIQYLSMIHCQLDDNKELMEFADKLEKATLETIESGKMTKDLALITSLEDVTVLNSKDFILAIRERLDEIL